ncbi:NMT1/THI5 like protein [uncultured archaeon]|nr:NMT1/THI5 like protein [uncultured archaeon]
MFNMEKSTALKNKYLIAGALLIGIAIILSIAATTNTPLTGHSVDAPKETPKETTQVTVAYLPVAQVLPLSLAIEKGYFTKAGINVTAVRFESPNLLMDAIVAGRADFGAPGTASGITGIVESKKPGELKVYEFIGGGDDVINDLLLVRKNSTLQSIADLKGKNLGILPGIQFRTIARHILAQNNLTADKDVAITEIAPGLQVQALAAGQVDALLTIEPMGTVAKENGIGKDLIRSPMVTYISNPWYGAVGVVRTQYAQENPETTKKFIEVLAHATDEINSNPESSKQYLKGYVSLSDQLIQKTPLPVYKMYTDFTKKDVDSYQQFLDIFTKYGVINGTVNANNLIYNP